MKFSHFIFLCCILISCSCNSSETQSSIKIQNFEQYETAYFASGCFWCVEAIFEHLKGVQEVHSGYSGGEKENPNYQEVSMGKTKHAEAVIVYYDPNLINFETLVKVFFGSHDPTTLNRQGPDYGPQYRSIAFYRNKQEKEIIETFIKQLKGSKRYLNPIITEIKQFQHFYLAEDYHQDFEARNPNHSYIRAVSKPRLEKFIRQFPELLK